MSDFGEWLGAETCQLCGKGPGHSEGCAMTKQADTDAIEPLVERVALAMAIEIGLGTFSHFNPDDMRRIARAAIKASSLATHRDDA